MLPYLLKPDPSYRKLKAGGHCQQAMYISMPYRRHKVFLKLILYGL